MGVMLVQQFRKFVKKSPCPEEAFYFQRSTLWGRIGVGLNIHLSYHSNLRYAMEKYWTKTKSHLTKRYTVESYCTCTKVRSPYLDNKGKRGKYGVILE